MAAKKKTTKKKTAKKSAAKKTTKKKTAKKATTKKKTTAKKAAAKKTTKKKTTKKKTKKSAKAFVITDEMIAKRAYVVWESKGKPFGQDEANWNEAKYQLQAELGVA